jgi:hypothetical protein
MKKLKQRKIFIISYTKIKERIAQAGMNSVFEGRK